jgi:hypothetical protein
MVKVDGRVLKDLSSATSMRVTTKTIRSRATACSFGPVEIPIRVSTEMTRGTAMGRCDGLTVVYTKGNGVVESSMAMER